MPFQLVDRDWVRVSCFEERPKIKVWRMVPIPFDFPQAECLLPCMEDEKMFFKFFYIDTTPPGMKCIDCYTDISRRKLLKNGNRKKRCVDCESHRKKYFKVKRKNYVTQARHKRRALIKQSEVGFVPPISDLVFKQGGRCAICNGKFSERLKPTIDHIIPIIKGGPHIASNVQALCRSCNAKKGSKILTQTVNNRKAEP